MPTEDRDPWSVFLVFLRLGLTAFGGPVAHIGYFRAELVTRRQWLSERAFADLVALCQFLPGPASSQVGMALGFARAGYAGALAAWLGFTLPSALVMILLALGLVRHGDTVPAGALHGLKLVAVAIVAQALWGMGRSLAPDAPRLTIAVLAATATLLLSWPWVQPMALLLAGLAGSVLLPPAATAPAEPLPIRIGAVAGSLWLILFLLLLLGLPLLAEALASPVLLVADAFYRAGSLVFGGGHVVLPLLQALTVAPGWVDDDLFLAGYGAVQAMPGPLFTFAAFLGAVLRIGPGGWSGGLLALVAIFLPAFLLLAGALPFWERLRRQRRMQAAMAGINAAVVGLLLAALYHPVWTGAVATPGDFALVLLALLALMAWKLPPWLVVLAGAAAGWLVGGGA